MASLTHASAVKRLYPLASLSSVPHRTTALRNVGESGGNRAELWPTIRERRSSEAARLDSVGFFFPDRALAKPLRPVTYVTGSSRLFGIFCARVNIFEAKTARAEGSWSTNSPQARWQQWRGLS
jgi:hypothetical protein